MSATAAAIIGGALPIVDTIVNASLVKETNAQNERLMRESWSRDDTAVQRRVADLKAAGLSPTLAAGSAAANSGPISLKSPQINTSAAINNALGAASAVKALKHQELENEYLDKQKELLDKQIQYYGYPDWAVAMIQAFGMDKFQQMFQGAGDAIYNWLSGLGGNKGSSPSSPSSSPSTPSGPTTSEEAKTALEEAGVSTVVPSVESRPNSFDPYSIDASLEKDARSLISTMIRDGKASTKNMDFLAHFLSQRYDVNQDDVRYFITKLYNELKKQ